MIYCDTRFHDIYLTIFLGSAGVQEVWLANAGIELMYQCSAHIRSILMSFE